MNANQAKQLDFPLLLQKLGYQPIQNGIKKGGGEIWFRSPLNMQDRTPSFHLSKGHTVAWVFKCFSTGREGTIIDFVIAKEGYQPNDVKSALAYLRDQFRGVLFEYQSKKEITKQNSAFSFHKQTSIETEHSANPNAADRQLEYLEDLPLKSGVLLKYLEKERKIPINLAQRYLRLVRYRNLKNGKTFFAIGMKNRAGGFEIRAATNKYSFKSALIARDITVINGQNKTEAFVVEGMTDALSFLVIENAITPPCNLIVMHSVNSYPHCKNFLNEQGYLRIHLALDNDKAGRKYTTRFQEDFGEKVLTHSAKFAPHKDLNKALQQGENIQFFIKENPIQKYEYIPY